MSPQWRRWAAWGCCEATGALDEPAPVQANEVEVESKTQLAMIKRLESALTLQDEVASIHGLISSVAGRVDGLESDTRARGESQAAMNRSVALQLEKYLGALRYEADQREVAEGKVRAMSEAVDDLKSRVESFKYEVAALRDARAERVDAVPSGVNGGGQSGTGAATGGEGWTEGAAPPSSGGGEAGGPGTGRVQGRERAHSVVEVTARGGELGRAARLSPITASRGRRTSRPGREAHQSGRAAFGREAAGHNVQPLHGPAAGVDPTPADVLEAARVAVAMSKKAKGALSGLEARLESVRSTVDKVAEEAKGEARSEAAALRADFAVLRSEVRAVETAWTVERQSLTEELERHQRAQRALCQELVRCVPPLWSLQYSSLPPGRNQARCPLTPTSPPPTPGLRARR